MMINRVTLSEVGGPSGLAAEWQEFDAGNLRGVAGAPVNTGLLTEEALRQYVSDGAANRIVYTVVSYRTPIAWVRDDGRVFKPDVFYGAATTRHQNLLKFLSNPEEWRGCHWRSGRSTSIWIARIGHGARLVFRRLEPIDRTETRRFSSG